MPYRLPGIISTTLNPNRRQLVAGAWIAGLLLVASPAIGQVQLMSEKYAGSPESDTIGGCFRETAPGGTSNPHRTGRPISDDGRYVVFQSIMDGLDSLDNNGLMDVFRHDLQTGVTELVSANFAGDTSGNGVSGDYDTSICQNAMISADGRYVVFHSFASDLVATDSNGDADVFRRDMQTGTTEMVSINAAGTDSGGGASRHPVMSPDGRFIAFTSNGQDFISPADPGFNADVFVRDMDTGTTQWASVAIDGGSSNRSSEEAAISDDGRYVAFRSAASDLHALDTDTNLDVFQRDLIGLTTALVSIDTLGTGSGDDNSSRQVSMSGDGRYVLFKSRATNLVAPDNNSREDVFAWDRDAAIGSQINLVSANMAGTDSGSSTSDQPVISRDGSRIAFRSAANDLDARDVDGSSDVYARDISDLGAATPTYYLVSATPGDLSAGGSSQNPAISTDGRYVAFRSTGNDIVTLDTAGEDVFIRDLQAGITSLASPNSGGIESGNDTSDNPAVSGDGSTVAYLSEATDLVANDINAREDVFAFTAGAVSLVSARDPGIPTTTGNERSWVESQTIVSNPRRRQLSDDGRFVAFESQADNLIDAASLGITVNASLQVYLRDRQNGTTKLVSIRHDGTAYGDRGSDNPVISGNGQRIAYESEALELVNIGLPDDFGTDIFVWEDGFNKMVSLNPAGTGRGTSERPSISLDGRYIAFQSASNNLSGETHANGSQRSVMVRDVVNETTELVDFNFDGTASGDNHAQNATISNDGRHVAFESTSTNLAPNDYNDKSDFFLRDLDAKITTLLSVSLSGTAAGNRKGPGSGNDFPNLPSISGDGKKAIFHSRSADLVSGDFNDDYDAFAWARLDALFRDSFEDQGN